MKEYRYKVVVVTYPARDGASRQGALKKIFYENNIKNILDNCKDVD